MSDKRTPLIFISYSHDSREHKQWVLELASKLQTAGIETLIDQWDLENGDDIPKYMEQSVTRAERVLMICTEAYVQKVDDGAGGAGYEAMIVTQELIRDLGSNKFIPVFRQTKEPLLLPKCIGTRKGANLSEINPARDEELTALIAQLHRLPPASKPPLGPAPISATAPLPSGPKTLMADFSPVPEIAYDQALTLARSNDLMGWRRMIAAQRGIASAKLIEWRNDPKTFRPTKDTELPKMIEHAMAAYQSLFAVVLGGIESMEPKFNQQAALIHDLRNPKGWERNGPTVIVELPDSAAWIFQALVGAMSVHTGQLAIALTLAAQRIESHRGHVSQPLFLTHFLVGWPESIGRNTTVAWNFLWRLPNMFPWLAGAFGEELEFREALVGYYLVLSWMEYVDWISSGMSVALDPSQIRIDVPTLFLRSEELQRGIRKVLEDRAPLLAFASKRGVSAEDQAKHWKAWVGCLYGYLARILNDPFPFIESSTSLVVSAFVSDLNS